MDKSIIIAVMAIHTVTINISNHAIDSEIEVGVKIDD